MTDDERLMLEEMKRREQKLKLELDEQESQMRAQQQLLREQEAERNRLAEEFEAMQLQVIPSTYLCFSISCISPGWPHWQQWVS